MSKKIYLSPSSQPANLYAAGDTNEQTQCRRIALAAVAALKRCGFEAMTNVAEGKTMYDRVGESNAWGANLHIPLHTNAGGGGTKQGTQIYYKKAKDKKVCHLRI
jgi:N-acetylmuramoyl-L-alanine amidase